MSADRVVRAKTHKKRARSRSAAAAGGAPPSDEQATAYQIRDGEIVLPEDGERDSNERQQYYIRPDQEGVVPPPFDRSLITRAAGNDDRRRAGHPVKKSKSKKKQVKLRSKSIQYINVPTRIGVALDAVKAARLKATFYEKLFQERKSREQSEQGQEAHIFEDVDDLDDIHKRALANVRKSRSGPFYLNQLSLHLQSQEKRNHNVGSCEDKGCVVMKSRSRSQSNIEKKEHELFDYESLWSLIERSKKTDPRALPISNEKSSSTGIFYKAYSVRHKSIATPETGSQLIERRFRDSPEIVNAVHDWLDCNLETSTALKAENVSNGEMRTLDISKTVEPEAPVPSVEVDFGLNEELPDVRPKMDSTVENNDLINGNNEDNQSDGKTTPGTKCPENNNPLISVGSDRMIGVDNTGATESLIRGVKKKRKNRRKSPRKSRTKTLSSVSGTSPRKHVAFNICSAVLECSNNRSESQDANLSEADSKAAIRQATEPDNREIQPLDLSRTQRQTFKEFTLTLETARRPIESLSLDKATSRDQTSANDVNTESIQRSKSESLADQQHSTPNAILEKDKKGSSSVENLASKTTTPGHTVTMPNKPLIDNLFVLNGENHLPVDKTISSITPNDPQEMHGKLTSDTVVKSSVKKMKKAKSSPKVNKSDDPRRKTPTARPDRNKRGESFTGMAIKPPGKKLARDSYTYNKEVETQTASAPKMIKPKTGAAVDRNESPATTARTADSTPKPQQRPGSSIKPKKTKIKRVSRNTEIPKQHIVFSPQSNSGSSDLVLPCPSLAVTPAVTLNYVNDLKGSTERKIGALGLSSDSTLSPMPDTLSSLTSSEEIQLAARRDDGVIGHVRRRRSDLLNLLRPNGLENSLGAQRKSSANNVNDAVSREVPRKVHKDGPAPRKDLNLDMDVEEVKSVLHRRLYGSVSSQTIGESSSSHVEEFKRFIALTRSSRSERDVMDATKKLNGGPEARSTPDKILTAVQIPPATASSTLTTDADGPEKLASLTAGSNGDEKINDEDTFNTSAFTLIERAIFGPEANGKLVPRLTGFYRHRRNLAKQNLDSTGQVGDNAKPKNTYLDMLFSDVIPRLKLSPPYRLFNGVSSSVDPVVPSPPRSVDVRPVATPRRRLKDDSVNEMIVHLQRAQSSSGRPGFSPKKNSGAAQEAFPAFRGNSSIGFKNEKLSKLDDNRIRSNRASAGLEMSPVGGQTEVKRMRHLTRPVKKTPTKLLTARSQPQNFPRVKCPKKAVSADEYLVNAKTFKLQQRLKKANPKSETTSHSNSQNPMPPPTGRSGNKRSSGKADVSYLQPRLRQQTKLNKTPTAAKQKAKMTANGFAGAETSVKDKNAKVRSPKSKSPTVSSQAKMAPERDDVYMELPSEAARRQRLAYINYVKTGTRMKFPESKIQIIKYLPEGDEPDQETPEETLVVKRPRKTRYVRRFKNAESPDKKTTELENDGEQSWSLKEVQFRDEEKTTDTATSRNGAKKKKSRVKTSRSKAFRNKRKSEPAHKNVSVCQITSSVKCSLKYPAYASLVWKEAVAKGKNTPASGKADQNELRVPKSNSKDSENDHECITFKIPAKLLSLMNAKHGQEIQNEVAGAPGAARSVSLVTTLDQSREANDYATVSKSDTSAANWQAAQQISSQTDQILRRQKQTYKPKNISRAKKANHNVDSAVWSVAKRGNLTQAAKRSPRKKFRKIRTNVTTSELRDSKLADYLPVLPENMADVAILKSRLEEKNLKLADNLLKPGQKILNMAYDQLMKVVKLKRPTYKEISTAVLRVASGKRPCKKRRTHKKYAPSNKAQPDAQRAAGAQENTTSEDLGAEVKETDTLDAVEEIASSENDSITNQESETRTLSLYKFFFILLKKNQEFHIKSYTIKCLYIQRLI
ncbi:hypothetical protein Btru_041707 [Bulinus truncatus]|nr:hypothetical protein Btru_041707 [Bulinus truncatus]